MPVTGEGRSLRFVISLLREMRNEELGCDRDTCFRHHVRTKGWLPNGSFSWYTFALLLAKGLGSNGPKLAFTGHWPYSQASLHMA
jgi:hypothetical protein